MPVGVVILISMVSYLVLLLSPPRKIAIPALIVFAVTYIALIFVI